MLLRHAVHNGGTYAYTKSGPEHLPKQIHPFALPHFFSPANARGASWQESPFVLWWGMVEEWRDVVGYEGRYQVSSVGRVRSIPRFVNSKNGSKASKPGMVLRAHIQRRTGYPCVCLCKNNKKANTPVHRLVCEAFHGPRPYEGAQVAHNDGSRDNNCASNLRWTDAKGNAQDRDIHGTGPQGEGAGNHKLTEADVLAIRADYQGRRGDLPKLSRRFGVTIAQVWNIVHRKQWTHI